MKIKLKYFLHPIKFFLKIKTFLLINSIKKQLNNIKRGKQDFCWCGGNLITFNNHPNYKICSVCGTYVNWKPPLSTEMKKIYSFDFYWHTIQQSHNYPSIEDRFKNDTRDGRIKFWINLIKQFSVPPKKVIEVGCAYGGLLYELKKIGYDVLGVEPDKKTAEWTAKNMGIDVRSGFFPIIELPKCDLFLSFDVLEHSPDPKSFIEKISDLLSSDGIAIIQTPINRYDYQPPFGDRFKDTFSDLEHLFIFTDKAVEKLIESTGLKIIKQDRLWLSSEIVILQKSN